MGSGDFDQAGQAFDRARQALLKVPNGDDETAFRHLAELPPVDYDRARKASAKRLGVTVATLDREVEKRRPCDPATSKGNQANGSGRSLSLPEVEPWPDAVDGAALLSELCSTIRRHVSMPAHAAVAVALWVVWSWLIDRFDIAPRLAVLSPEKRCGKTTLLELLSHLTPRALLVSGITPSAIFRTIEAVKPTLLIDEADTFAKDNEELRGVLNSGHTRASATIIRNVGDPIEPRMFSTWTPMVLAAIGSLPDTVEDRSIIVRLQRKAPGESVTPFPRSGKRAADLRASLQSLARKVRRWMGDLAATLCETDPKVPAGLHDRAADNWRPLLALADALGGEWPERAREAAVELSGGDSDTESHRVRLLKDVRAVFESNGWDRVASQVLCDELAKIEEAPWSEWRKGKPISPAQLARILKPFGIVSGTIRLPNGETLKGYYWETFGEAFGRYLPSDPGTPISKRHTVTTRASSGDEPVFRNVTPPPCDVSENATIPAPDAGCDAVTDQNGTSQGEETIFEEDHAPRAEVCSCCLTSRFWESIHGAVVCGTCHPPAAADLVRRWLP
jgi:putative DNA primase/helicase